MSIPAPSEHAVGEADCPFAAAAPTDFDHNSTDLTESTIWSAYEELRAAGAVSESSAYGGFYLLSQFDAVKAALRAPATFKSSGYGHRIPVVGEARAIPIDYDPPIHTEYRRVMSRALEPKRVRELQPFVRGLIEDLVESFYGRGGGDAVAEVALPLPLRVLTEVVGFSSDTVSQLRALTEEVWTKVNDSDYDEARKGIRLVIEAEVRRHRSNRIDDYLSWLIDAEIEDRPIEDDEATRILMSLAIAGHETTMNASSTLMWLLATNLELQDRLRAHPDEAPKFVEELIRLRPPAQNFARQATESVQIGGVEIPAESRVLLCYAAANRDAKKYDDPDSFNVDRASRDHLGFGFGIHQCIGAGLVRSELKILLETLCNYPRIRLAGEVPFGSLQGGTHYGPHSLPLRFED